MAVDKINPIPVEVAFPDPFEVHITAAILGRLNGESREQVYSALAKELTLALEKILPKLGIDLSTGWFGFRDQHGSIVGDVTFGQARATAELFRKLR